MSMGVNMQWGYSGLINFGVMGFLAIGGLAVIVISVPPVYAAWDAGGTGIIMSGLLLAALVYAVFYVHSKVTSKYNILNGNFIEIDMRIYGKYFLKPKIN